MREVTILGLDLVKWVFHVHGAAAAACNAEPASAEAECSV